MSTFFVDASFYRHPKCVALRRRPRAIALWLLAGSWSAGHHTGGLVNLPDLAALRAFPTDAEILVRVGLWEPVDDCGYRFHNWDFWNSDRRVDDDVVAHDVRVKLTTGDSTPNLAEPVTSTDAASRAGARARGTERSKTKTTTSSAFGAARTERDSGTGDNSGAGGIVGGWLESVESRPPQRVVGQVARLVREMQTEGIAEAHIVAGLNEWSKRGLHPSVLPSVVHQMQQNRRRSATDQRVADNLQVVERYARREGRTQ